MSVERVVVPLSYKHRQASPASPATHVFGGVPVGLTDLEDGQLSVVSEASGLALQDGAEHDQGIHSHRFLWLKRNSNPMKRVAKLKLSEHYVLKCSVVPTSMAGIKEFGPKLQLDGWMDGHG